MPHGFRKLEQPLPATLLSLFDCAAGSTTTTTTNEKIHPGLPAQKILDCISDEKDDILALRLVCRSVNRWLSPLNSLIFQKITFIYPALIRQKRREHVKLENLGVLYGQFLETASLDALLRIEPYITHVRLKIAPAGSSNLDPGTQLLDSLLQSKVLEKLSIHLIPDDKCLPPALDSIAPRAVSNHLWTLPYFAPEDGISPPPLSGPHPETETKKDFQKTEQVSHALSLLHLSASLERSRPFMHAFRSLHFENLSIQGVHALSAPFEIRNSSEKKSKGSIWCSFPLLQISMIKWWTLPVEHWPFFETANGNLPIPGTEDPASQRSREVNLKLRGWQVLTRWLRSLENGVQILDFNWVEPRVLLPPAPGATSPTLERFSPVPQSSDLFVAKDSPLHPLDVQQSPREDEMYMRRYSNIFGNQPQLPQKSSVPEMSNRAAIESYSTPSAALTPQLAWRITEGPNPLSLNGLKDLEKPLTWRALRTLALKNIHIDIPSVRDLLTCTPCLETLVVSPDFIDDDELPLLSPKQGIMLSPSSISPRSQDFGIYHTTWNRYNDSSQVGKEAHLDIPRFLLLHQSPRRHRLRKRSVRASRSLSLTRSNSHSQARILSSGGKAASSDFAGTTTSAGVSIASSRDSTEGAQARTSLDLVRKVGSAVSGTASSLGSTLMTKDTRTTGPETASMGGGSDTSLATESSRTMPSEATLVGAHSGLGRITEGEEGFGNSAAGASTSVSGSKWRRLLRLGEKEEARRGRDSELKKEKVKDRLGRYQELQAAAKREPNFAMSAWRV